jgi:nucleotide-binding universal stress UspA family protein
MSRSILRQADHIAVAVGFDEHTPRLIAASADLCRRLRKKLDLVHVVEPWQTRLHAEPFGEPDPLWNATLAVETSARDVAGGRLEELAAQLAQGVDCACHVVVGKRVEALCRETQRRSAGLLLVGTRRESGGNPLSLGMSTGLALLATAPVPVAIVGGMAGTSLFERQPRLLLADDLGPASEAAAAYAFELAAGLGSTEVMHVHVNGITPESLVTALTMASSASHTPADIAGSGDVIYERLLDTLGAKLADRARPYMGELATAGCDRAFHAHPFGLGRLPFKAMLAFARPVVVVPND